MERSGADGHRCINSALVNVLTKRRGGAILLMECKKLQERIHLKMKPTGCESCGAAEGLAILKVKSLKFYVRAFKTVRFSPTLAVVEKRNRAALHKRGYRRKMAVLKEHAGRAFKSLCKRFLHNCIKTFYKH